MDDFLFQLQELIARNKIQQVIKTLLETFQKCESKNPASKDEMRDLRNQVVLLSARYNDTTDKINIGTISPLLADTAKNQLLSAFLNITGKLPDYPEFSNYINGLEEEEAWDAAVKANNIETYRIFFTQHPNGKYKEETQRVISELETIQKEKETEIKQKAEAEKARRVNEEKKQKAETQLKKEQEEKARRAAATEIEKEKKIAKEKEHEQKEKEARTRKEQEQQKELDDLKKQLAQKEREQKEREQKEELAKEKLAQKEQESQQNIHQQQKEREALAKKEQEQNKAAKNKNKAKPTPIKEGTPQSTPLSAATISVGSAAHQTVTLPPTKSSIFNSRNILWTLLPFTMAPFAAWLLLVFVDSWELLAFSPLIIAYAIIAFVFPLKPQWYSLISITLASLIATATVVVVMSNLQQYQYGGGYSDRLDITEIAAWFAAIFTVLAFFTNIILYFRNKALSKDNKRDYISKINLFSKQNRWWTLMAFPITPILAYSLLLAAGNIYSLRLELIFHIVLAYAIVSFIFPLKPQKYSLISIAVASFMIVFAHMILVSNFVPHDLRSIYRIFDFITNVFLIFAILSIISNIILYFRNKALDKKLANSESSMPLSAVSSTTPSTAKKTDTQTTVTSVPSTSLFSKQKIWWSLLPFTLAPFSVGLNYVALDGSDNVVLLALSLTLLPIAYAIISYKFPLKPQRLSLISVGIASIVLAIAMQLTWGHPYMSMILSLIAFAVLAVIVNITLHFRNKALNIKQ